MKNNKLIKWVKDNNVVLILILIFAAACIVASPKFTKVNNFFTLSQTIGTYGILAIGMTFIFLVGGIDLSIAYQVGFTGTIMAMLVQANVPTSLAILGCLVVGILLGYINGTIVTRLGIPSLIGTLAVMTTLKGFVLLMNDNTSGLSVAGHTIFGMDMSEFYNYKLFGFLAPSALICIIMLVVLGLFLARTRSGINLYVVGGNPEAGQLSGINNGRLMRFAYAMGGFCAAVCAFLTVCRMNASTYNMGDDLDITAICAVVIGGIKMSGGKGNMGMCIMGVAVIQIIKNVMIKLGYQSSLQALVTGIVVVLVLILDRFTSRKTKAA